jgi:hypothetical protein
MRRSFSLFIVCFLLISPVIKSQTLLSLKAQLRTRTEFRDGYATLNTLESSPAFFTSQRTRFTAGLTNRSIEFRMSIQDTRLWGQDASTINNSDGNRLMLHEGWALMNFLVDSSDHGHQYPKLQVKVGRQSLLYDDSRLLGDLDWLQQGRRHDALVVKYRNPIFHADAGFAFNQHSDATGKSGTFYQPGNVPPYITNSIGNLVATPAMMIPLAPGGLLSENSSVNGTPVLTTPAGTNGMNQLYKALQFVHLSAMRKKSKLSILLLADQFAKYRLDSSTVLSGNVYGRKYDVNGVNGRFTYGGLLTGSISNIHSNDILYTLGLYGQSGKNKEGKKLAGWHFTSSLAFKINAFSISPGFDYLSGNPASGEATVDHRFDPLYGTPHKFWGMMDYYYVATGSPTAGLMDPNIHMVYSFSRNTISADVHHFLLSHVSDLKSAQDFVPARNLGTEFDFVLKHILTPVIFIEFGYALMIANNNTEYVKKSTINQADHLPQWAYLMVSINPEIVFGK